ncbi:hypothetical protein UlMin_028720 [Ulmus minor]
MAARTIEVTVLSAENLRMDRKSIKKNAFVIIRTDGNNYRTTQIDAAGGSFPRWNEKFILDLPVQAGNLTVEVHCKTALGYRAIGTAIVPVSDFIGGYVPEGFLHFLSYRLRDHKGERNGIVNISVRTKVLSPVDHSGPVYGSYGSCSATTSSSSVVGMAVGKMEREWFLFGEVAEKGMEKYNKNKCTVTWRYRDQ